MPAYFVIYRDVLLAWKHDRNIGADFEDFDDVYGMATGENILPSMEVCGCCRDEGCRLGHGRRWDHHHRFLPFYIDEGLGLEVRSRLSVMGVGIIESVAEV